MGTGRRKNGNSSQTTVTTQAPEKGKATGIGVGGDNGSEKQSRNCWTFTLESPTDSIQEIKVGMSIQGQAVSSAILVVSPQHGALGRAPSDVAKSIVKAQQNTGGSLSGAVLKHLKTTMRVELCLR